MRPSEGILLLEVEGSVDSQSVGDTDGWLLMHIGPSRLRAGPSLRMDRQYAKQEGSLSDISRVYVRTVPWTCCVGGGAVCNSRESVE